MTVGFVDNLIMHKKLPWIGHPVTLQARKQDNSEIICEFVFIFSGVYIYLVFLLIRTKLKGDKTIARQKPQTQFWLLLARLKFQILVLDFK